MINLQTLLPETALRMALVTIEQEVKAIRYESPEDEGASEWQGHLESVRDQLERKEINVSEAEDSLGIFLVYREERRVEQERDYRRTQFAAFGGAQ